MNAFQFNLKLACEFKWTPYCFYLFPFISESGSSVMMVLGNPSMVTALAGNKADLEEKRKVETEASIINLFPDFFLMS